MKQIRFLLALAGIATFFSCTAVRAQQTNAPQNFFTQAMTWGSHINMDPAYNWTNATIQIDTGIATTTGVGIADRVNVQYNKGSFGFGGAFEFVGVGSTVNLVEGTVAYSFFQRGDFKWDVELGGGYDFNGEDQHGQRVGSAVIEPGTGIYKIMTPNSYAVLKMLIPWESHGKFQNNPKICAGVGGTF